MTKRLLLTAMLIWLLCCARTQAQIQFGQPASGGIQMIYTRWEVTQGAFETSSNQVAAPVTGFVPLKDNLEMRLYIASGVTHADSLGKDLVLSGAGDLRVQFSQSLQEDQLLLSGGINLPTGRKNLDSEGQAILDLLSQNYLQFPFRRLGEGFGFNLLAGVAQKLDRFLVGGGITYQYNGSYEPYEASGDYDPGDMISINAGAELPGEHTTASVDVIYSLYTDDKLEDTKVFRQSPTFDSRLGVTHKTGVITLQGSLRYILRGDNKLPADTSEAADLISQKLFGDELLANLSVTFGSGDGWRMTPYGQLRTIAENEAEIGSASIVSVGATVGTKLGEQVSLSLGGEYSMGDANDGNIDITGYRASIGLTAEL